MKKNINFIFTFLALLFSCSDEKRVSNKSTNYVSKIIQTDEVPSIKLSLDVILTERVEKEELTKIGLGIYEQYYGASYSNVFIIYYLKGMTINNGGYASTHFTPNLDVSIYGLTNSDIKKILTAKNFKAKRYWFDDGMKCIMSIEKVNNNFYLKNYYTSLQNDSRRLKLNIKRADTIFEIPNMSNREYYKINSNKELEQYDNQGLVYKLITK